MSSRRSRQEGGTGASSPPPAAVEDAGTPQPPSLDDQARERAAQGDAASAAAILVRAHLHAVHGFCHGWTASREQAAILTRDVFLRAHQGLPNFRFEIPARAWLLRIARNRCLEDEDRARIGGRSPSAVPFDTTPVPPVAPGVLLDDPTARERVDEALDLLQSEDRALMLSRHRDGIPDAELALVLADGARGLWVRVLHSAARVLRIATRPFPPSGEACAHPLDQALAAGEETAGCPACDSWRATAAELAFLLQALAPPEPPMGGLITRTVEGIATAELNPTTEETTLQAVARQVRDRSTVRQAARAGGPPAGRNGGARRWVRTPAGLAVAAALAGIAVTGLFLGLLALTR